MFMPLKEMQLSSVFYVQFQFIEVCYAYQILSKMQVFEIMQILLFNIILRNINFCKLTWAQSAQGELLWPAFVRRPSSCVVRRLSFVLLKHLLLWNRSLDFDQTSQEWSLGNRSLDFDQTSQEWSLGGPLPKLFKPFQLVAYVGHGVKK